MMLAIVAQMQIISQETAGTLATLLQRTQPIHPGATPSPVHPSHRTAGFGTITAADVQAAINS